MINKLLLLVAGMSLAAPAPARLVDIQPNGFLVTHEVEVHTAPGTSFDILVGQVGQWWDPEHTYSHAGGNLSIDATAGGCFCERLTGGGSVQHMTVVYVQRGRLLRLAGALGPLQGHGLAGSLTWQLEPAASGTRIRLSYSVGGYLQGGFEELAPAVDTVLGAQLARLKAYIDTGRADPP